MSENAAAAGYMRWRTPTAVQETHLFRCAAHPHQPWMGDSLGCEATRYASFLFDECAPLAVTDLTLEFGSRAKSEQEGTE